ncbi:MAG TPA: nuclear transport factor 2 family protein [Mycobacteriales bacterium]|nr:nuclear transport factor 2 family protein [Mycobacteriales bacterium]
MKAAVVEEFVRRFEAAWAARDPALLQALFHPDAVVRQPPVREPFRGDQVADYFTQVFAGIPGLRLTPVAWAARGDVVMIEWEITAPLGDDTVSWQGVDRFRLRDALAIDESVYYDSLRFWERVDPSMRRDDLVTLGHGDRSLA